MTDSENEVEEAWDSEEDDTDDTDDAADTPRTEAKAGNGQDDDYVGDERANQALDFVSDLVSKMQMDCKVRLCRPKEGDDDPEISIEIYGPDAGRIIGKKGQVLGAIQFLTHRVINRPGQDRRHLLVDAEGYRSRRDDQLSTMAQRLGKQAVEQGKIITFEPMNPRDRRVVHLALAKFEGVITKSDGEGDDRRVQIIPVRRAPAAS